MRRVEREEVRSLLQFFLAFSFSSSISSYFLGVFAGQVLQSSPWILLKVSIHSFAIGRFGPTFFQPWVEVSSILKASPEKSISLEVPYTYIYIYIYINRRKEHLPTLFVEVWHGFSSAYLRLQSCLPWVKLVQAPGFFCWLEAARMRLDTPCRGTLGFQTLLR